MVAFRRFPTSFFTLALLTGAFAGNAAAAPPGLIEHEYTVTPEDVLAYWTDERLAAVPDKGDVPVKVPGSDAGNSDGDAWSGRGFPPGVGRLFLVRPDGGDASCTATVVDSPGGDVLVTAFHCLTQEEGPQARWSSRLMFAPGFGDGQAAHGRFVVRRAVAPADANAVSSDAAFLQVGPRADGARVATVAGSQAVAFDHPVDAGPRVLLGYPVSANGYGLLPPPPPFEFGNAEYSGQRLAFCSTQRLALNGCAAFGEQEPSQWGLPCVMGPGSSGGPALVRFDMASGQGTVVGVNSMGVVVDQRANLCAAALDDAAGRAFAYISGDGDADK